MSIFKGSMNHTFSGRKKVRLQAAKSGRISVKSLNVAASPSYRRDTVSYPSVEEAGAVSSRDMSDYKAEISSKYTIAPAYNKGAYQVISRDNVKHIGK